MSPVLAQGRHRAHHSIGAVTVALAMVLGFLASGCAGGTVPVPVYVQVRADDYVEVPFLPQSPPVEIVPQRPAAPAGASKLVWADGGWIWSGARYRWNPGAWVAPPPGAKRARWVVVRRVEDGQLFFAPSRWQDANGSPIASPTPLARASTRVGGPAGAGELTAPGGVRSDLDE